MLLHGQSFLYDPSLQFDIRTNTIGFDVLDLWLEGMLNKGNSFYHVSSVILLLLLSVEFHSLLLQSDDFSVPSWTSHAFHYPF